MSGNRMGKMSRPRCRAVRVIERRATAPTWASSPGAPTASASTASPAILRPRLRLRLRPVLLGSGTLELAPGLGEEDIIQGGLMQLQGGEMEVCLVEHAKDVGELRLAAGQLHGDAAAAVARDRAEARELLGERVARARIGRRDLDARAADLLLQPRRRALGDDPAAIDDSDPVCQQVTPLETPRRR